MSETKEWEKGFTIAYLLKNDITPEQLRTYRNECPFVDLRNFDFTEYPEFVQNLYEYQWKPLMIEKILLETEKVLYFDSSVVFQKHSGETLTDIFIKMDTQFINCGIRLFDPTSHSILSATNPKMLQYFNMSEEIAKNNWMYGATEIVVARTPKSDEIIVKWSQCSLENQRYCYAIPLLWIELISLFGADQGAIKLREFRR